VRSVNSFKSPVAPQDRIYYSRLVAQCFRIGKLTSEQITNYFKVLVVQKKKKKKKDCA